MTHSSAISYRQSTAYQCINAALCPSITSLDHIHSDAEAEVEAPEAVAFWWKRKKKHLKMKMLLLILLCLIVAVQILVDFCSLEVIFSVFVQYLLKIHPNHSCLEKIMMLEIILQIS
jgi:hypothetical protein